MEDVRKLSAEMTDSGVKTELSGTICNLMCLYTAITRNLLKAMYKYQATPFQELEKVTDAQMAMKVHIMLLADGIMHLEPQEILDEIDETEMYDVPIEKQQNKIENIFESLADEIFKENNND